MAACIGVVFDVTMVIASLVMDLSFTGLRLVPARSDDVRAHLTHFAFSYTFWRNLLFGPPSVYLWWVSRQHPVEIDHGAHDDHAQDLAAAVL